jgi:hypothetical protein
VAQLIGRKRTWLRHQHKSISNLHKLAGQSHCRFTPRSGHVNSKDVVCSGGNSISCYAYQTSSIFGSIDLATFRQLCLSGAPRVFTHVSAYRHLSSTASLSTTLCSHLFDTNGCPFYNQRGQSLANCHARRPKRRTLYCRLSQLYIHNPRFHCPLFYQMACFWPRRCSYMRSPSQ